MICNLCPRGCNAERLENKGNGFCRMGYLPKVARIAPHMWEEPCISGTKGSGAIFFSGCTLRCVYCQNYEISAQNKGTVISVNKLAEEFKRLENMGVHNINLVSPTPYVHSIIEALNIYKPEIPIVYNSGGYEDLKTLRSLEGYVDIYLPDFKYSSNELGKIYSNADSYVEITKNAIREMINQTGKAEFDNNGLMKKGTIIRHLVLPNHTKNSIGVLDIIKENFEDCMVSLMGQYVPLGKAEDFEKLKRKITQREYNKVKNYLFDLGLEGFVQELSSADEKYVPSWDYK
ncbi:MAG: radical SAM protein [Ruminococcus sp.]